MVNCSHSAVLWDWSTLLLTVYPTHYLTFLPSPDGAYSYMHTTRDTATRLLSALSEEVIMIFFNIFCPSSHCSLLLWSLEPSLRMGPWQPPRYTGKCLAPTVSHLEVSYSSVLCGSEP